MQTTPVGIVGASGYSGLELSRILALHPRVELKLLGSDKWAGETAARRAGLRGSTLYPRFYGFEHPRPDLLSEAIYGLPELTPVRAGTRLVVIHGSEPT